MKLWKLTPKDGASVGGFSGYDTYDSAVVAANTEEQAKAMHPREDGTLWPSDRSVWDIGGWVASPEYVNAECIGNASSQVVAGVIVASFNAG